MKSNVNSIALITERTVKCAALLGAFLTFAALDPAPVEKKEAPTGTGPTQAHDDYLIAINLAEEGGKPEALHMLAESLRLQPEGNPAAGLAFQLLTELRTNSGLALRGHTDGVLFASYSPDGKKIITTSEDHTARIWDARTGLQLLPPLQHDDDVLKATFSPDGSRVATASEDGSPRVWSVKTGKQIGSPIKETDAIISVKFSPDGKLLATGADNNYARILDATTGKTLITFPRYHESVFSVNFSPDGKQVITATGDGKADIYDPYTGKLILGPILHKNNIFTAVYSPDGKRILTGSADDTARIWDAKTGTPIGPVLQHGYWIFTAAFNTDASKVITSSWDHTARVWDAATGNPITPPLRHGEAVTSAVFSPDGTLVATASRDHTARIWDAATGNPLSLPLHVGGEVTSVVFNHDGTSLLVASKDKVVQFWDMPPHETPPSWVADLAEFASTHVRYDTLRKPEIDQITALRAKLLATTSNDPWEKYGRWYFLESDVRPISPWSTLSLQEYVDGLIKLGDKDSIDYAISLSQDRPAWMVKLVPLRAKFTEAAPPADAAGQPGQVKSSQTPAPKKAQDND